MTLSPPDIQVLRTLLPLARAAGWRHLTYGGDQWGHHVQHIWRSPRRHRCTAEKVELWQGSLEYREADHDGCKAKLQVETAAEVRSWLLMLGLIEATAAEVAEAMVVAS
jgi:hypothetical protein